MANCSRCSAEDIIIRYGLDNVLEIIDSPHPGKTWNKTQFNYNFMTRKEGQPFKLTMTIFSTQHSMDEDCSLAMHPRRPNAVQQVRPFGFPKYRATITRYY